MFSDELDKQVKGLNTGSVNITLVIKDREFVNNMINSVELFEIE
jgi:hypothetical protein